MASATQHIVQPYRVAKRDRLVAADALPVRSAEVVRERAGRLFETGRYVGVDAYSVTADPDLGEYDEPVILVWLGRVPDYEAGA